MNEALPSAPGAAWLRTLASPKLSAAFFVITAAGALWASTPSRSATLAMLLPFSLLAINLLAAIVTNRRFRADLPLLVFHLSLLSLICAFVIARLTYFEGQATVTAGMQFDGKPMSSESGELHNTAIERLRFTNHGFTENFPARGLFHATYNRVGWQTADGQHHIAEIGDDIPLILNGYRIYTTRHRGFSPVFRWETPEGHDEVGTVQLRDSNNGAFAGANDWTLPNGQAAWLMVEFETPPPAGPGVERRNLGTEDTPHHLVLRIGDARHELKPGEDLALRGGKLTYLRLGSWMGYRFISDPTKPWLVGSITLAVLSLVWYYTRFLFRPISPSESRS